jgi:hypothetical protein
VARLVWVAFWVVTVSAVVLAVRTDDLVRQFGFIPVLLAFATVGAVVVARQPGNPIGWLCCIVGLAGSVQIFADVYTHYAFIVRRGSVPGGLAMGWLAMWLGQVYLLTVTFLPLLFPTGRLPSRRWRPVAWAAGAILGGSCLVTAVMPGPVGADPAPGLPPNPLGLLGAEVALQVLDSILAVGLGMVSILCAVSVVSRFRRARGIERQQLKWFTYGTALLALLFAADFLSGGRFERWVPRGISDLVFGIGFALIPVTAGIAILRFRLYDIDRLINRTLVYGLVTAVLGLVYAGAVLVLGEMAGGVAGNPPSWAVAGATLAVAALIRPARRRIQAIVDRRFDRRKYNAATTIEAFSTRLRDHVDLDTLSAELMAVVDQTMQPATTSLWLRPSAKIPVSDRGRAP